MAVINIPFLEKTFRNKILFYESSSELAVVVMEKSLPREEMNSFINYMDKDVILLINNSKPENFIEQFLRASKIFKFQVVRQEQEMLCYLQNNCFRKIIGKKGLRRILFRRAFSQLFPGLTLRFRSITGRCETCC